jgi:hypothetical protein
VRYARAEVVSVDRYFLKDIPLDILKNFYQPPNLTKLRSCIDRYLGIT